MPADFRVSITNPPGKTAYPIASFTWLLIPTHAADAKKGEMLKQLVHWCLTDGESMASSLSYAPLPKEVADKALATLNQIVK